MVFAALPADSLIGVIAPAGPTEPERLARVPALYESQGYRCRIYPGCHQHSGYLAGDDSVRLADLHAAVADDGVAAIHALRGGYGCMRLLDGIDTELLRERGKLLIGYSDITALHALWCAHGLPSLHAPMAASDLLLLLPNAEAQADCDALFALLRGGIQAGDVWSPATACGALRVPGQAEGRLVGGNLSLVAALLGTPWAWRLHQHGQGAILFLEDINEEPYRVDRLLTQLRLAGVLDAVAGFVLGSFTQANATQDNFAKEGSAHRVLQQMLCGLGKPVLGGWPAGHGTPNRALPLGLRVRLTVPTGEGGDLTWLGS